ncbi:BAR adaptor protein Hob1 [Friedmanniomyces endolithicus]|nr:BAR adaptor protein Hob1 [Friedmanniomyces endolithicus]KAK0291201.1 BAR adaptor protein Hob1 [Friedmanniomyces endolithicus]KAK0996917.1 BAR adaptor protein Hob1 [Friedmanniomyces endolithicus]
MQLNVFYTLHEKMQSIDIGYFNLTKGIEEAFEEKRGDTQAQTEALGMTKFKTTGGPRRPLSKFTTGRLAIENGRVGSTSSAASTSPSTRRLTMDGYDNPPPPYSTETKPSSALVASSAYGTSDINRSSSTGSSWTSAAKSKAAPPPPPTKPKPGALRVSSAETVTALYDYEAQAEGDLSFSAGEVVEIVTRTGNENEWWVGKIGGRRGQFPGNYVQLNS